jgi:hypothetical protein
MAITSTRRIPIAQEFVRIGFGDAIDDAAPFYSHDFLTQELTTTEVQAVLPIVKQYNNFVGEKVAAALESFRGKVGGWKFGCAGSPLLIAVLAPWTHQLEESSPRNEGTRIPSETRRALISEMEEVFLRQLGADIFEPCDADKTEYRAWWD